MSSVIQDIRYAVRQLIRSPSFAVASILTLALCIGANTAVFSVVNGLLLRGPAGVVQFDRLVSVYTSDYSGPEYGTSSLPDIGDFGAAQALEQVAAYTIQPVVMGDEGGANAAEMVLGQVVTSNFFDVLGIRAEVGRTFTGSISGSVAPREVVVLEHDFWQTRFGGDRGVVGETVRLAGVPHEIVGVAPEGFSGLLPVVAPAVFVPVEAAGLMDSGARESRGSRGFFTFARLTDGATIDQAREQLHAIAERLHEQYPDAWTDIGSEARQVTLIPASESIVPPQIRGPVSAFVALLAAIVVGVLLIGCANIANLLLARATRRKREMGIRLAIGAGRARLIRQLLTESLVVAFLGTLVGLYVATVGTRAALSIELVPSARAAFCAA